MLFIEMSKKKEFPGENIAIMLFRDITKIVITGGLIGIMLFIEMEKLKISRRPYWNYVIHKYYKNKI